MSLSTAVMNIFFIAYVVFLVGFFLASAAIIYHLVKFQLNRRTTVITSLLFLAGVAILLLINIAVAIQINWDRLRITL